MLCVCMRAWTPVNLIQLNRATPCFCVSLSRIPLLLVACDFFTMTSYTVYMTNIAFQTDDYFLIHSPAVGLLIYLNLCLNTNHLNSLVAGSIPRSDFENPKTKQKNDQ